MTVYLADPDVTLHHGDVLETLRTMPDGSVDCVVTSPPYWGLRDYGTGSWEGGDPDCDHKTRARGDMSADVTQKGYAPGSNFANYQAGYESGDTFKDVCGKCGATRQDQQLGLEPTPDLFVARMVEVFREVRRVLAPYGTCWVNLGDSYAATASARDTARHMSITQKQEARARGEEVPRDEFGNVKRDLPPGLKPKDLVGIPWRVAFALQADGWYLRSDIVWSKPNPMPESVTDRPTKAHEYVFLLTKQPRYFFDQEAVREPISQTTLEQWNGYPTRTGNAQVYEVPGRSDFHTERARGASSMGASPAGRNVRSVWDIATQPYPEAHFATYPEELVRRCLLAGCPEWVCRECGKPRERIVERTPNNDGYPQHGPGGRKQVYKEHRGGTLTTVARWDSQTLGWSDCGHNNYRPGIVLDPFVGSGTTAHVARKHARHAVGIDLNSDYLALAARRLQQLSLFAGETT